MLFLVEFLDVFELVVAEENICVPLVMVVHRNVVESTRLAFTRLESWTVELVVGYLELAGITIEFRH